MEHRWRFVLGAVTLSTLLGGMLRAQIVPYREAAIAIYWPVGTILTIFLAMGPVSMERAGGTWGFLLAQPLARGRVLRAKWFVGLLQLWGLLLIACVVGSLALWSRGFYGRSSLLGRRWEEYETGVAIVTQHPIEWLVILTAVALVVLSCWYTFLFFVLTRARNEFTAALGGILLTAVFTIWVPQYFFDFLRPGSYLNPFVDFLILAKGEDYRLLLSVMALQVVVWGGMPLTLSAWRSRRPAHE